MSLDIIAQYEISGTQDGDEVYNLKPGSEHILGAGGECDQPLQEFHRFDESLSIQGKWQGGSVTGVCRGWGTPKVSYL